MSIIMIKLRYVIKYSEKVLQEYVKDTRHGGVPEYFWRDVPIKEETDDRNWDEDN